MAEIVIATLPDELKFTNYHRRRGELRDCLRFGVYPNLVKALDLYAAFLADYGPGGAAYDPQIWEYYQNQIAPIADVQGQMISGAAAIVAAMEAVETAVPGTFGIVIEQTIAEPA